MSGVCLVSLFQKNIFKINLVNFREKKSKIIGCRENFDSIQKEIVHTYDACITGRAQFLNFVVFYFLSTIINY